MSAEPDSQRNVTYIVEVKDGAVAEDVAAALRGHGLQVERVLGHVGLVGARGPGSLRERIAQLPGVGLVREEAAFQLPPFEEGTPQ